jgi:3-methyladenine DNA glycosylase/8-oxoguanine DNA glycosylase
MNAASDPLGARILSRREPVIRDLLKRHGPCPIAPKPGTEPYHALVRSVVYQQLSGKAAATIHGRVLALFPAPHPTPQQILNMEPEKLRGAGLSGNKLLAIQDIARKALDGTIPKAGEIDHLPDEDIIQRLISVRGIGRWSVEMFLMFNLGRPDVWPVDDLGVRKGYGFAFGMDMPSAKELAALGEQWRPYRSLVAWLMWRACEDPVFLVHAKAAPEKTPAGAKPKPTPKRVAKAKPAGKK